jgi:hypothetical protein
MRTMLLVILLLGLVGSLAELILLGHYEDWEQWIPLTLLISALVLFAAYAVTRSGGVLKAIRWVSIAFVVGGITGIVLHYRGNAEFEREMVPTIRGVELVWEALRGATPALAPGTLVQLGLVALAYLYRHPVLAELKTGKN